MRKFGVLTSLLIFLTFSSWAQRVSVTDAKVVARNFINARSISTSHAANYSVASAAPFQFEGVNVYYILNLLPQGWIVISASHAVKPVLAYSFEEELLWDPSPPSFKAWMEQYSKSIRHAIMQQEQPSAEIQAEWDQLRTTQPIDRSLFTGRTVEPLIYSKWNQGMPYNGGCPSDPAGPGGHAYAGCVPTCMGQIMYYYRWPDKGVGSYTYTDPTYGIQSVGFDSTWYMWENMKNSITKNNPGISQLLYHLGVSCDLVYGPNGSGMYNHKAAYALRTFFKYSPETQYLYRDSTDLNWDSVIIAHLDRKMPLYYAGWSVPNIDGHAFVCDGYQDTNYFHFNFGWGGSSDGYFYTDNLSPSGYNFNLAQELIINIYPDTLHYTYPQFCASTRTVTYSEGSITDGSGPLHGYTQGNACTWLFDPQTDTDSVSQITLSFSQLELGTNDWIKVYNGATTNDSLLGYFTGNTLPPTLTSRGNKMMVTFQSDPNGSGSSWYGEFTTSNPVWCTGTTTIQGDSAVVTDGSFRFNYKNNTICKWKLLSNDTLPMTIYFSKFDTEPTKDVLKIYDLDTEDLLASLSGTFDSASMPDSLTASKGKFMLIFTSNGSVTGEGFEIYYPKKKSTLTLPENSLSDIKIYPNPATDQIQMALSAVKSEDLVIQIVDVNGKLVSTSGKTLHPGKNQFRMDVNTLVHGVYFIRLTTPTTTHVVKLIKE